MPGSMLHDDPAEPASDAQAGLKCFKKFFCFGIGLECFKTVAIMGRVGICRRGDGIFCRAEHCKWHICKGIFINIYNFSAWCSGPCVRGGGVRER